MKYANFIYLYINYLINIYLNHPYTIQIVARPLYE